MNKYTIKIIDFNKNEPYDENHMSGVYEILIPRLHILVEQNLIPRIGENLSYSKVISEETSHINVFNIKSIEYNFDGSRTSIIFKLFKRY